MPLEIRERELPGVGVRYEVDLSATETVAVMVHNNGRRGLYHRDDPDDDYQQIAELSDSQARAVGLLLVGAYYQPVPAQAGDITPTDERIKWHQLDEGDDAVGRSLESLGITADGATAIVAVIRDGKRTANPKPSFVLAVGDDLAAIGDQEAHNELGTLLRAGN